MSILAQTSGVETQPSSEEWKYEYIPHFMGGVEDSLDSRLIPPNSLTTASNVRLHKGAVNKDFGITEFGDPVLGIPMVSINILFSDGTTDLVLVTTTSFYRWNDTVDQWQLVSSGTSTTVNGAHTMGDTTIAVASDNDFNNGDTIAIFLNDGSQFITTVDGAPAGDVITIDDALPENVDSGNLVINTRVLAGSEDFPISWDFWPATDKLYFTNGVNTPMSYDGASVAPLSGFGVISTFSCKQLKVFSNRLVLGSTIEDGTDRPYRIRWSAPGVDNDWVWGTNYQDLFDFPGPIMQMEKLSIYLIIYKTDSITRVEFIGDQGRTFNFLTTIDSEGIISPRCVVPVEDGHILLGRVNLYKYDGMFQLKPIGDSVIDLILGHTGALNTPEAGKIFGLEAKELDEVWFFYPTADDEYARDVLIYNKILKACTFRRFENHPFIGYGNYLTQLSKTWDDLVGTWLDQLYPWNARSSAAGVTTILLLGSDQQVYQYTYTGGVDVADAIPYVVETKDFNSPDREYRYDRYDFLIRGENILCEASTDEGDTYFTLGTISPGSEWQKVKLFKQRVGGTIRFRFSGSDSFGLRHIGFRYKEEVIR